MNPASVLRAACAQGLRANAARFLHFIGPGPLEFQILGAADRFAPNRFCHARSLDEAIALLDVAEKIAPTGTYVILNAPDAAVTTRRAAGQWHPLPKGAATTDADIRARRALYIDVDAKRVSGTSATEAELACALATTERVYALLKGLVGADALAIGHSGNGGSVFIALDSIPETPELAALCKAVLAAVAARFPNEHGSAIDTTVCDAKRLCPAFGTTKRKGAPGIPERPHRPTGIATPRTVRRLSFGDLEGLLARLHDELDEAGRAAVDKATGRKAPRLAPPSATTMRTAAPVIVAPNEPFARAKTVPIRDVLSWLSLLDPATDQPTCPGCGLNDHGVAIVKNGLKCSHNRCASKGRPSGFRTTIDVVLEACRLEKPLDAVRMLGDRFAFDVPSRPPARPPPRGPAPNHAGSPLARHPLTDLGNAERLVAAHGHDLRHCAGLGWLAYDGRRWARDETGERMRRAKLTARAIEAEAATAEDLMVHKAILAWARKSEGAERLQAALRLAETEPSVAIAVPELDADPWALNVQNGTLDLRTGQLRPHRREDLTTKIAGTSYDPEAKCPIFERFLAKVFQENAELIAFVRRFMGYALTASVREQVLAFFYGAGANGKSTLIDLMVDLLGSSGGYARPAAPGLLLAKRGETHPTEVADLHSARLVTCVEIGDGKQFDEERVKALTGGDAIKARFMRQDFFTFNPTHKLLVAANHRPTIRGTDHAIWRRILLVPFNVTFSGAEKDPELPVKLRTELPGILRWAVAGCLEWQRDGLKPPPTVLQATSEYRSEHDVVGRFINERCVVADYASAGASELYSLYRAWATAAGENPITQTAFGLSLGERGFKQGRTKAARLWRGLGVLTEADDAGAEPAGGWGDAEFDTASDGGASSADVRGEQAGAPAGDASDASQGAEGPKTAEKDEITERRVTSDGFVYLSLYRDDLCTDNTTKTRHTRHPGTPHTEYHQQLPAVAEVDGFAGEPVINPSGQSSPSLPVAGPNDRPSYGVDDMLVQLRQVAPKLHVDAAGNLAGFGSLARWPEELLEAFDQHHRAIRDALVAEERAKNSADKKRE